MQNNDEEYTVKELLKDEFFVRWVIAPDDESNHYWTGVMYNRPELRGTINKAREILNQMSYENHYKLSEKDYTDMLDKLVKENGAAKTMSFSKPKDYSIIGIAASIVLIAAVSLGVYFLNITSNGNNNSVVENKIEYKQTGRGEKLTVKLPDGTTVKLNSISSLSYQAEFGEEVREVILEGEAFFDVESDPSRPFIIRTGDIQTTVLGTRFNVRSYKNEENIEVAVVEGKVKVGSDETNYAYLTPNEVSTYQKEAKKLNKVKMDVSSLVAWHKNVLVFKNATADEVWKRLENWYGINIIIKNKKNIEGRYSGIYENEPLETVLRGISFASGFDFEIDDKKNVIIK